MSKPTRILFGFVGIAIICGVCFGVAYGIVAVVSRLCGW